MSRGKSDSVRNDSDKSNDRSEKSGYTWDRDDHPDSGGWHQSNTPSADRTRSGDDPNYNPGPCGDQGIY